jgi:hypothetical protein
MRAKGGTYRSRACPAGAVRLSTLAVLAGLAMVAVPASHGGSLSEAAKEALKPPEKQHPVPVGNQEPPAVVATSSVIRPTCESCEPPPPPPPCPGPSPYPEPHPSWDQGRAPEFTGWSPRPDLHVGAVVATSALSSADFAPATLYGLRVGTSRRGRTVFDLVFLGGSTPFKVGSDMGRALQAPRELSLEGALRCSITPPHSAFGIAPVVGVRVGHLTWRYLNPIQLETPELLWTVYDDALWDYSPYLGIATTLVNTHHVELGVTALTGYRYYATESHQGLTNDLFPDTSFREIRFESRVVF